MARRIEKTDAQRQLGGIIRAQVRDAANGNNLVSKRESEQLDPFVGRAEAEVRAEKPPPARVKVDEVVDKAMANAMATWNEFQTSPRDAKYLSKEEVAQVAKADPALGALTQAAYMAAGSPKLAERVSKFLEQPGVGQVLSRASGFGRAIDARPGQAARAELPASVLAGFDAYYPAERADFASVTLKSIRLGGDEVYAVHTRTDGDDGYVEMFDKAGAPLVSGRLNADDLARLDPHFGLARYAGGHADQRIRMEEGYSEDPERRAAGQITSAWRPDAVVQQGTLRRDFLGTVGFDTNARLTPEQAELTRFALEIMLPRSLQHRADGPGPIDVGRNANIALGEFTDPRNAEAYLVADYRDIDNDAFTFYFQRSEQGVLNLARAQYNG